MKLPKQPKQIDKERQALAPYNFVELPESVVKVSPLTDDLAARFPQASLPAQDSFDQKRHCGFINCILTTESPVYVRAALTMQQAKEGVKAKDVADFFFVQPDEPMIPGSTLRGMFRGLIEIISFSKISEVTNSKLIYRAVGDTTSHGDHYRDRVMRMDRNRKKFDPKVFGGYLRQKGSDWYISPAEEIKGVTFAVLRQPERNTFYFDDLKKKLARIENCRNAYKVYIKVGNYEYQRVGGGFDSGRLNVSDPSPVPKAGSVEGTLALSGPMASKRSEAVIFAPDPQAKWLRLSDDLIAAYREQISKEQKKILGDHGALNEGQPVFYILKDEGEANDNELVEFFGHCRMLRLPYPNSPRSLVPEELRRQAEIDLTEALFGFTKEGTSIKDNAYAGRVSFTDAKLLPGQEDFWLLSHRPITPRILGTPKPTCFQHYLVQTQPNKFQVGRDRRGRPRFEIRLSDYNDMNTVIRGHKFYWHKGAATLKDIELQQQEVKEKVATSIRPVCAGVRFTFQIRFDNLSDEELGAMLWMLQIAADDRYRLKVGMGKPLGLGAVKIESQLILIDRDVRYTNLFEGDAWGEGLKQKDLTKEIHQRSVPAFERFILAQLEQPGVNRLSELERIQQLMTMLSWPGPNKERTRYLEIEHPDPSAKRGKRNEYKHPEDRPVLLDPLSVLQPSGVERVRQPSVDRTPTEALPQIRTGEVKVFGLGPQKSYGFIKPDSGGPDVYVRREALEGRTTLVRGQRVRYILLEDGEENTRPKAKRVLA